MKLLFLIGSMDPESNESAASVVRLTELIVRRAGVQVTVACVMPCHQSPLFPSNVRFFQFDNPGFPQISWLWAIADLRQLISQHDLVFAPGILGSINGLALRLAWQHNKPIYIRVCNMLNPYITPPNPLRKQLARILYLKQNLRNATGVIVNNESEARNVRQLGVPLEKLLVIPNGVKQPAKLPDSAQARRRLGLVADRPVLLYLGQLHPKNGLHVLLQAMALLPTHKRNFCLLVAGEYSNTRYQERIEELVSNSDLEKLIHFSGQVTESARELYFQAADAFIFPSQREGYSDAVLEAMAHGLPVIVTRECNLPEVADYRAGLVVTLSVASLVRALDWFMTGGDAALHVASQGALRLVHERFNLEQTAYQYQQILDKYQLNQPVRLADRIVS